MTKLRMKNTPEDIESILKSERRARKKRRKEEERTRTNDSVTPPRASTSTYLFEHDSTNFDESTIPPYQSRKPEYGDTSERSFEEKLKDAMEEDDGIGYKEELMYSREASRTAASFSYGGAAGIAMGFGRNGNSGVGMDEEEYAEMIRAGMWRLKNKDEAEQRDANLKAYQDKKEKEKKDLEDRKKIEKEKIKKLEEKVKRRGVKEDTEARKRYEEMWKKIVTVPVIKVPPIIIPPPPIDEGEEGPSPAIPHPYPLRFTDFPWPLYPPVPFPPLSWPATSDVTPSAISTFLLSHVSPTNKKSTLRTAVLAYHPDRFDRLLTRIPVEKEETKERVKELGLRISQVLNDLLKAAGN